MNDESTALGQIRLDTWSYLDFKRKFQFGHTGGGPENALLPMWVGGHLRRLMAYVILESYYKNVGRLWIGEGTNVFDEHHASRREYGDPKTIVDQIVASLIGETQTLSIPDAEGTDADPDAQDQHDTLSQWMQDENLAIKIVQCERQSVKLGDGVYALGWDDEKERPRLRVYDPGFYFPVLDEDDEEEFPNKVHIAWEFEEWDPNDPRRMIRKVRRKTWELVDLPNGGTALYPWNTKRSTKTVMFSDATWNLNDLRGKIENLDLNRAVFDVDRQDLGIDFIPVIHIPCRVNENEPEHFGTSALAAVLQVFDDLVSTDTDLQAASATTGTPPIALSGASAPKDSEGNVRSYGPGTVWETGDGTATVIDTSHSLDALTAYKNDLLSRLAVNSHVPEALLGRIKPNEVPSGIALTLSFTPHTSMIREMRLLRHSKYALMMKFVSRFFQQNGDLADVFPATIKFGSYLPSDQTETQTLVQNLLNAKAISRETAIRMLMEAGFPIDDAVTELNAIQANDFDGADKLLTATGDVPATREYLQMEPLSADILAAPAPAPAPLPPGPAPGPIPPAGLPETVPQPAPTPQPPASR